MSWIFRRPAGRLLLLILLLSGGPSATAAPIMALGRRYESVPDVAARYRMTATDLKTSVILSGGGQRLVLKPDSRVALLNNRRYSLSFAPLRRGRLYLSSLDMLTLLDPLLNQRSLPRRRVLYITLDPGHGGKDTGAIGALYREKNITLRLAGKVRLLLQRFGYQVRLTRTYDRYLTLSQRPQIARNQQADLFVSLHVNSAGNRTVSGIETYALTPAGAPSTTASKPSSVSYPGNRFNGYNILLAHAVHQAVLTQTRAVDRGVKRARFQVLREITCPAVLLEIGFISHRAEERRLGSDAYLDLLARGIANGILQYHRTILKNNR